MHIVALRARGTKRHRAERHRTPYEAQGARERPYMPVVTQLYLHRSPALTQNVVNFGSRDSGGRARERLMCLYLHRFIYTEAPRSHRMM